MDGLLSKEIIRKLKVGLDSKKFMLLWWKIKRKKDLKVWICSMIFKKRLINKS